ncbi:MAG: prepilin-type N-terminal cleavage/methylation domain-containing protein [gamma proteobacterium endosymbiont of Lamellibrachia anaximandri]|nr:prepilin-type N-terminal cleavage/methylation domain-containing protein [gamma proteobacterium endosymbiont of Lamellibrachia anaximandri]MBL3619737.1 prepilin-type N-terminal cleavage/methylation domain-containing protein [gamma proteobacterium endosymbiont of Lamellibrachia anaximandri]
MQKPLDQSISPSSSYKRKLHKLGITLIELLIAIAIFALVTAITIPMLEGFKEESGYVIAIRDIKLLDQSARLFFLSEGRYPQTLEEIESDIELDPWGNPYQYLNIADGGNRIRGSVRKDRNLVPLNTDFDIYSMGPDGESRPPLTARHSWDDIVRASNGSFIGVASEY